MSVVLKESDALATFGDLVVDFSKKEVRIGSEKLRLTRKKYELLELLAKRGGQALPRSSIIDSMYPISSQPAPKIVDVFVCGIRKEIARYSEQKYIFSIWGSGYMLCAPDAVPT